MCSADYRDAVDGVCIERLISIGFGTVFVGIAALLTAGLVEGIRAGPSSGFTVLGAAHAVLIVLTCWGLAGALFLMRAQRERLRRIRRACWLTASITLAVFLAGVWLKAAFDPLSARGEATLVALVAELPLLSVLLGVVFYLKERARQPADERDISSAAELIFLWPLMLLVKAPIAALAVLVVVGAAGFAGERIGACFGHPLAGAFCGPALLVVALFGAARLFRHRAAA